MRPEIICVHQVGKVGSTTVSATLERMLPVREIYQTHVLSNTGVLNLMLQWLESPTAPRGSISHNLLRSIELSQNLLYGVQSADWYVFSIVRDPLARNVSAFFQNLHNHWIYRLSPSLQDVCRRAFKSSTNSATVLAEETKVLVRELVKIFLVEYPHTLFDNWFNRELQGVFEIDVFARPFSIERGYDIYQNGSVRLLLMRLEGIYNSFAPAINEWLANSSVAQNIGDFVPLERVNDGSTKEYSSLYRSFLDEFRATPEVIAHAYESNVARHFYTDKERAEFQAQWKIVRDETFVL